MVMGFLLRYLNCVVVKSRGEIFVLDSGTNDGVSGRIDATFFVRNQVVESGGQVFRENVEQTEENRE